MESRKVREDGTFEGCVLPPKCSRVLLCVSWLVPFSSLYGFSRGYFDLGLASACVFVTSVNYWREPKYGWRRSVDIVTVHLVAIYQWMRSLDSPNVMLFNALFLAGVLMFVAGCAVYHPKRVWASTLLHMGCHLLGNASNLVLYASDVEKVTDAWFMVGRLPDLG
eukprot:jgi/Bigna1/74632/fgenesh1_pg.30_\